MSDSEFRNRQTYSAQRIQEVRERILQTEEITRFDNLSIYATGSLGRGEALREADLDIFVLKAGASPRPEASAPIATGASAPIATGASAPIATGASVPQASNNEQIIASMNRISTELRFPKLTTDFELVHYAGDIIESIGSQHEDAKNIFTARMLMLLEGTYLFNQNLFSDTLHKMIHEYFRDYHDNEKEFLPVFLINDIIRFWKTMCLNYENKRGPEHVRRSEKRFRLKYSRLVTCFSMIAPIISEGPGEITEFTVRELASLNPWQRLVQAAAVNEDGMRLLNELRTQYVWFLRRTANKERLDRSLSDPVSKNVLFDVANRFNQTMYDFLKAIGNPDMLRYLAL